MKLYVRVGPLDMIHMLTRIAESRRPEYLPVDAASARGEPRVPDGEHRQLPARAAVFTGIGCTCLDSEHSRTE